MDEAGEPDIFQPFPREGEKRPFPKEEVVPLVRGQTVIEKGQKLDIGSFLKKGEAEGGKGAVAMLLLLPGEEGFGGEGGKVVIVEKTLRGAEVHYYDRAGGKKMVLLKPGEQAFLGRAPGRMLSPSERATEPKLLKTPAANGYVSRKHLGIMVNPYPRGAWLSVKNFGPNGTWAIPLREEEWAAVKEQLSGEQPAAAETSGQREEIIRITPGEIVWLGEASAEEQKLGEPLAKSEAGERPQLDRVVVKSDREGRAVGIIVDGMGNSGAGQQLAEKVAATLAAAIPVGAGTRPVANEIRLSLRQLKTEGEPPAGEGVSALIVRRQPRRATEIWQFGTTMAVLLDKKGRVVGVIPPDTAAGKKWRETKEDFWLQGPLSVRVENYWGRKADGTWQLPAIKHYQIPAGITVLALSGGLGRSLPFSEMKTLAGKIWPRRQKLAEALINQAKNYRHSRQKTMPNCSLVII